MNLESRSRNTDECGFPADPYLRQLILNTGFWVRIHWFRIRIRHLGWILIRIRIQEFDDQKLKLNYSWKKFDIFLIKIAIYLSQPPKRTAKLQKPSVLKTEHPALQNMNFLTCSYFYGSFSHSWIRIHPSNLIQIQSESETLVKYTWPGVSISSWLVRGWGEP